MYDNNIIKNNINKLKKTRTRRGRRNKYKPQSKPKKYIQKKDVTKVIIAVKTGKCLNVQIILIKIKITFWSLFETDIVLSGYKINICNKNNSKKEKGFVF